MRSLTHNEQTPDGGGQHETEKSSLSITFCSYDPGQAHQPSNLLSVTSRSRAVTASSTRVIAKMRVRSAVRFNLDCQLDWLYSHLRRKMMGSP